jgi:putative PEP-CTERM system histidine kinase
MPIVAIASHSIGAILFFGLSILLVTKPKYRWHAPLLVAGCLSMALWGILSAFYTADLLDDYRVVALSDVLRNSVWCLCILQILNISINKIANPNKLSNRWYQHKFAGTFLALTCLLLAVNTFWIHTSWLPGSAGKYIRLSFIGHIAIIVTGLALIEQLYRNTHPEKRWGIKFFCLAIGSLFCYDFYMYSNAILFNHIDKVTWEVRGAVSAIVAPLIGFSAIRSPKWTAELFPSRQVIYRSTVFVSCGIYLLLMGLSGYYIRHFGGTWGKALQVVFIVGAIMVLMVLISSGTIRSHIKLFLSKHLFKLRFDYRQEWLDFTKLLAYKDEDKDLATRIITAMANFVESPAGCLYSKSSGIYTLSGSWNLTIQDSEIDFVDNSLIKQLESSQEVIEINQNYIKDHLHLSKIPRAWLIIPLIKENKLEAFVILSEPRVKNLINWEVKDLLKTAANQAAITLAQEKSSIDLAIARQFEGYNRLSAFMLHDLKNISSQLSMVNQNKEKFRDNPKFVDSVFLTVENASNKIDNLISHVTSGGLIAAKENVNLLKAIKSVINQSKSKSPLPSLELLHSDINAELLNTALVNTNKDQFINVLYHLVENAQQATDDDGKININLTIINKSTIKLEIADTGKGMSRDFIRNKLFKPFVSTKGNKGMGIGVFQAREFIHSLKGTMSVESEIDKGTRFTISLPVSFKEVSNNSVEIETNSEITT